MKRLGKLELEKKEITKKGKTATKSIERESNKKKQKDEREGTGVFTKSNRSTRGREIDPRPPKGHFVKNIFLFETK